MGASVRKSLLSDEHNLEIFSLAWLDASVNTTTENIHVREQLRTLVNQCHTFDNTNDCLHYIRSIPKQNRIILIVSGRLGREIVPRIHRLRQISSIYVYCMDKQKNESWAQKFPKIKGVIVNLDELVGQIRSDRSRRLDADDDEPWSFNVYRRTSLDEPSITDSNNQFIHSGLLIDCLLYTPVSPTDRSHLVAVCKDIYKSSQAELAILDEFERSYTARQALCWLTRDSSVSRLLNKALQAQTVDVLYLFRFFLRDVREQLELNKYTSPVRAYRGQLLSADELQVLKSAAGGLISISSFLSAQLNRQKALKDLAESDELHGALFEIDADPRIAETKPFSNIKPNSYAGQDDEILFLVGSIFRIDDIHRQPDGLCVVRMVLCADNDVQLKSLFKSVKPDATERPVSVLSFGDILWRMGKLSEAEKFYHRLLSDSAGDDDPQVAECYYALGNIAIDKDDCHSSAQWHQKSLEIKTRIYEENDPSIADSYSSIADVERKQGHSIQALESYQKALDIWTRVYHDDHPKIAMCLNNIGCIYGEEKNYMKTLECQEKALRIMERHFPADHLCLGHGHNNIGSVYRYLGNYELALQHYQIAAKIKSKSFSARHPTMASTFNNIACVYEEMHEYQQALAHYEKAAAIYRHNFPPTYPDNVRINEDVLRISNKLKHRNIVADL